MKTSITAGILFVIIVSVVGVFLYRDSTKKADLKTAEETRSDGYTTEDQQPMGNQQSKQLAEPTMIIDENVDYSAQVTTSAGSFTIALNKGQTPKTVNNFVYLANKGFYNGTIFHRVIKGFMIQGGDPTGTGSGGPGYQFVDEPFVGEYTRGTVAMANAGPDTNGSQFFVVHKDAPLQPDYTIFGHVTDGLDVIDTIANQEVEQGAMGESSKPVKPVKIVSVVITPSVTSK